MQRNGSRLEKDKRRRERRVVTELHDLKKKLRDMRTNKHKRHDHD